MLLLSSPLFTLSLSDPVSFPESPFSISSLTIPFSICAPSPYSFFVSPLLPELLLVPPSIFCLLLFSQSSCACIALSNLFKSNCLFFSASSLTSTLSAFILCCSASPSKLWCSASSLCLSASASASSLCLSASSLCLSASLPLH